MSVFSLLTSGLQPLGSLFMGFTAAAAGIRVTIGSEAVICFLTIGMALFYLSRGPPEECRRPRSEYTGACTRTRRLNPMSHVWVRS